MLRLLIRSSHLTSAVIGHYNEERLVIAEIEKRESGTLAKKSKGTARKKTAARPEERGPGWSGVPGGWRGYWSRVPSWWPLPLLMGIGLLFRLSVTLWDPLIYPDSLQYMHLAKEIHRGAFFQKNYDLDQGFIKSRHLPPLYSFLLAPFATPTANLDLLGRLISLSLSLLAFIPFYYAAQKIFSRRVAVVGVALFSFHYFSLWFSMPILSEPTFTSLYAATIAGSVAAFSDPRPRRFALCGLLSALLYMTRDVGITAAPLIGLGALVKLGVLDRRPWRPTLIAVGALALAFLICATPYFVHIRTRTGHWGLTAQMSNTSITKQIQLDGGDRYDRDRLPERQKGTNLIGGQPAQGFADLLGLAPQLLTKLVKNMGAYGIEISRKWGPFILSLALIGILGVFRRFWQDRNRERLFLGLWVALWAVQLWAMYSLITPYMVDERYMYPLVIPGLLLAGAGVIAAADWLSENFQAGGDLRETRVVLAASFAAAVCFGWVLLPWSVEPEGVEKFFYLYRLDKEWAFSFVLAGQLAVFMVALGPAARLLPARWLVPEAPAFPGLALAGGLIGAGIFALLVPGLGPRFVQLLPASLIPDETMAAATRTIFKLALPGLTLTALGAAVGFGLATARRPRLAAKWSLILPALLLATALAAQTVNYLDLHYRMSPRGLLEKYATGYRQAAAEIKAQGLVPPGKVICSRKPFMAYYLDGRWYLDTAQDPPESMPMTIPDVAALVASGKIDYLAVDSFTLKSLRPMTTELAYGRAPLPGARVIYSRYFASYERVITVYDCRQPEPELPRRLSAEDYYQAGLAYYKSNDLVFADRELKRALELDPNQPKPWLLKIQIYQIFFQCSRRGAIPTLAFAPRLLPDLVQATREYERLAPEDSQSKSIREFFEKIYVKEDEGMKDLQKRNKARPPEPGPPEN